MEAERRIGVAVDFSSCSKAALRWAIDNVVRKGDHLILVIVRPEIYEHGEMQLWGVTGSPFIPLVEFSDAHIMNKYEVKPDPETVDIISTAASQKEITVLVKIYWGDAREKLVEAVDKIPLSLLVMGNRGLGKLKRKIMDSLKKHCQIPFSIMLLFFLICSNYAEVSANPSPRQPAASPQPQNSAPTANAPSPSSLLSHLPRPHSGAPKTSPRGNLFRQPSPASSPPAATADPSVKHLCDNTDYPELCVASVLPFLSTQGKTSIDALSMLEMVIKASSIHAKLALAAAASLATGPNNAHRTSMALVDCKDLYSDALDGLQGALDSIPSKDIGTINSMLSSVITDSVTCEYGFDGQKSPLRDYDDKLRKLGSNCLAIASLVKW